MRKASKHVQPYSPEFRAEAIRLARTSGKSHADIAEDLGMTSETLRLWLKQADLDTGKRHDGLTSDEQEELRRLRRGVRILREEREILKKAAAHLPLGRPTRPGEGLRVHGAGEGHASRPSAVPGARCLSERVLGVAAARALCSQPRQRPAHRTHDPDSPAEPGHLWGLASPGRAPGSWTALRAQPGGPAHAPGGSGGLPSAASCPCAHDPARSGCYASS
jgi:transposase